MSTSTVRKRVRNGFIFLLTVLLHLAFAHFDKDTIPSDVYIDDTVETKLAIWNKACDIYITRFLMDIQIGTPTCTMTLPTTIL